MHDDTINEPVRIREKDCLFELFMDLRSQACLIRPYDADAREGWLASCGEVLAQVPDDPQRTSWAYFLALDLNLIGSPLNLVMALLLARAAQERISRWDGSRYG